MSRLFIIGYGYTARAIVRTLRATGFGFSVSGTASTPEKANAILADGVEPVVFDTVVPSQAMASKINEADYVIMSVPPGQLGDPLLLGGGIEDLRWSRAKWIGYLSTVGVYGDHKGAWVDEGTQCRAVSQRSELRIEAEKGWMQSAEAFDKPLSIFRLAGIYGPGRNAFVNLDRGTAHRIVKPGQVFNRIHVDDIALAVSAAMNLEAGGIYNVADDEPAPPQDVVAQAARLMEVEPPPEVPFEEAQLSPMGRSFYGENKRVSNARMKSALGVTLEYPTYREGLAALWSDGSWRG